MNDLSVSLIDILVVLIIVISAIYAAYRGFVSETLSIFAWVAGAFAALYFGPPLAGLLEGKVSPDWLAPLIGYLGVFLAVVIPLSFISYRFSQNVKNSPVSTLDRVMGFIFGIVRGLAVIGFLYFLYTAFVPVREQPAYMTTAYSLPIIQGSSEVLLSLVPEQSRRNAVEKTAPKIKAMAAKAKANKEAKVKAAKKKAKEKAYGESERRALDTLIETTDDTGNGGQ